MSKESYLKSIYSYPEQFKQAWEEAQKINVPENFAEVGDAIISGMGASIFGGLALQSAFSKDNMMLPLTLVSDYALPEYADERSLLLTTSYSGNTEETVSTFEQGLNKGCRIITITSGGKLQSLAQTNEVPLYCFDPKYNPSKAPRTAVGYIIGSTLSIFSKLGLLHYTNTEAKDTYNYMRHFVDAIQKDDKMPSQVAQKLYGRIPIFVSAEHLTAGTHIWRNFMNETSKHAGFAYEIPAMNHHFLDGLQFPPQIKDDFIFVFVMSKHYSANVRHRFEISREITKKAGMLDISITLGGHTKFSELFELIIIGSVISYNIADYHKVDPSTNEMVDYLKAQLAKRR